MASHFINGQRLASGWSGFLNRRASEIAKNPTQSNLGEITQLFGQAEFLQKTRGISYGMQKKLEGIIEKLNEAKRFYEERQALSPRLQKIVAWMNRWKVQVSPEGPVPQLEGETVKKDTFYGRYYFVQAFNDLRSYRVDYAAMTLTFSGLLHLWNEIEQNCFLNWEPNTPKFIDHLIHYAAWRGSPEADQVKPDQSASVKTMLSEYPELERTELIELTYFDSTAIGSRMSSKGGLNAAICQVQTAEKTVIPFFLLFDGRQKEGGVFYLGFKSIYLTEGKYKWDQRLAIVVASPENLSEELQSDVRFGDEKPGPCTLHLLKRKEPPAEEAKEAEREGW